MHLLPDGTIVQIAGCTAREIRDAFDRFVIKGRIDHAMWTVSGTVSNTRVVKKEKVSQRVSKLIQQMKILRWKVFLFEATKMIVSDDYEGAGEIRRMEDITLKNGRKVKSQQGELLLLLNDRSFPK